MTICLIGTGVAFVLESHRHLPEHQHVI